MLEPRALQTDWANLVRMADDRGFDLVDKGGKYIAAQHGKR